MEKPSGVFDARYEQDMAILRTRQQWLAFILFLVFLFTLPLYGSATILHLANLMAILIVAAFGLSILTGYTGQISIGHAAFVAIGAYTSAILTTKGGLPFWLALPGAGLMSGIIGIVFGLPAVRIKGFYLVMSTLAAQFIIIYVITHWHGMTGGPAGYVVPSVKLFNFEFHRDWSFYYISVPMAIIMGILAKNIVRTRVGRAFVAIRDNDLSAEVMGINLVRYKLIAFFIASFYAGVAGSLWAHWMKAISYEQFGLISSVWYLGYIIVGGMGSTLGPVFGVVTIVALTEFVSRSATSLSSSLPLLSGFVFPMREVVFGLVIILFLIFEPRGLSHRWEITKASLRLWPFPY